MVFRKYGTGDEMEGIREGYERALRKRAEKRLEDARDEFKTNIDATINEAKSFKYNANKDTKETQNEWE